MNSSTNSPPFRLSRSLTDILVASGCMLVVLAWLYSWQIYASGYADHRISILQFARTIWGIGEDWQHCYLVPVAVAVVIYFDRKRLAELPISRSWWGLAILIFGLFVYAVGFRADNVYLGYLSFQILTGGLILWLLGPKWGAALAFPWAFLVFLYPLTFMDNFVAFPLRLVMSETSINVLNFIGIPAVKSGTAILSAADPMSGLKMGDRFSLDVADPCSGIRSLFALMMVTALYSYLTQPTTLRKTILFLCSVPLAVLGNLFRILMLTVGTLALGSSIAIGTSETPSWFHELAGYAVFAVALGGMLGVGALLNLDWLGILHRLRTSHHKQPAPVAAPSDTDTPRIKSRPRDEY